MVEPLFVVDIEVVDWTERCVISPLPLGFFNNVSQSLVHSLCGVIHHLRMHSQILTGLKPYKSILCMKLTQATDLFTRMSQD